MNAYVLDACALIAYFNNEIGANHVEKILSQANCTRLMSIINVYEVCYDSARVAGFNEGLRLYQEIKKLPITIMREIEDDVLTHAIHFKITYQVSVADSIALGLAKSRKATLVTSDHHEFDPVAAANELSFSWIR
jgi:uncharacterized protein